MCRNVDTCDKGRPYINPFITRQKVLKLENLELSPFLASLESLLTNKKGFPSNVKPPFNWCPFSNAD